MKRLFVGQDNAVNYLIMVDDDRGTAVINFDLNDDEIRDKVKRLWHGEDIEMLDDAEWGGWGEITAGMHSIQTADSWIAENWIAEQTPLSYVEKLIEKYHLRMHEDGEHILVPGWAILPADTKNVITEHKQEIIEKLLMQ